MTPREGSVPVGPDPIDAPERRRAVEDLDTTLLVEAAAGSGKTTLLLGRIVSLVESGRARLDEIAAVTFTEKAAADLRVRLRAVLEQAGLDEALRQLETARIGTIHAFAAELLRERPVEAGIDPGFTVADPLATRLMLDRAWEAWLPGALSDAEAAGPVREAIERGVSLARLRQLADALVDARDRLDGLPGPEPYPEPLDALSREARATLLRLAEAARGAVRDPADRAARALEDLAAWVRHTEGLPADRQARALLDAGRLPDKPMTLGNKAKWRNKAVLEDCRAGLAALRERVEAARAVAQHNLVAGLARWAAGFVETYGAVKARAGCLDFLDLLLGARDLVRDRPDVRQDFQRGLRYLLVDEFQDTDPLQLETVLCLAEGAPPGSLFVVGDPKQSIYRFRRADIETYEWAKTTIAAGGDVLSIRANFRSTRAILDAVNAVFEGVMTPPPDGAYQPAYVPLEPSPRTLPGSAPVILALPEDAAPPGDALEAAAQEAALVAAYLVGEVEGARRFAYGDVALLFRAMTGVVAYEDAFRAAGVPFRTVGGRHYYDRSEVGWTIAALVAIEDPHDPVALVGALRSPLFGASDAAIGALAAAGGELCYLRPLPSGAAVAIVEAWALLGELHRERNAMSPAAVVERLYARTQVLAAYALEPQGEARVANLLKVLDTARALEATGSLTFRGLVRWLRDRGAARYEEEESSVEAEDAVRLMTIHKAKGLEFPVVVVPDLGREPPWRAPVVLADRRSGRLAVNLARTGDEPLATLDWADAEAREIQRVEAESLRLLYVALTRAERVLVLPQPVRPEGRGFYQHLAPILGAEPVRVPLEALGARPVPAMPARPPEPGDTLAAWRAGRMALFATGAPAATPAGAEPAPLPPPGGPRSRSERARRRASVAAAELARAALLALDLAHSGDAGRVVAALGARRGAPDAVVAEALGRVARALAEPALLRAARAGWLRRDVPVVVATAGEAAETRLDLLFEEESGLVAVRLDVDPDAAPSGPDAAALAGALGRPVRELAVVSLAAG